MQRVIEFAVFHGALGLDITGPLEVFNTATELLKQKGRRDHGYSFRYAAAQRGAVRLSSGLEITATNDLHESLPIDTLLVPGGADIASVIQDKPFMSYVASRSKQARRVISVCSGSFILAATGLLDGKQATTHWMLTDKLESSFPKVNVDHDSIFVRSDNVYTSAGVSSGIDLALAVIEEDHSASLAMEVAGLLVMYYRRPGSQSQFSHSLNAQKAAGETFSKLHGWLEKNISSDLTVDRMATQVGMSPRNFARVFKAKTGQTPSKYLEILRLDRAREIMAAGDEPLERIAEICGFGREERLRRAFLRQFDLTPSPYRLHFRQH